MENRLKTRELRDLIRFLTVLLLVPWLGWFTESLFGVKIEFEVEMVTFLFFIVFGSFWCGWLCPFGNLSYFIEKIGRTLFPSLQFSPKGRLDKILRLLKYIFLSGFAYLIIIGGYDYFWGSHMAIYKSNALSLEFLKLKKYMIMIIPLVIPRFFCKYICPQKAMYNIIHKFLPTLVIERDEKKCVSCGRCDKACPMDIKVSKEKKICGRDCISCFNCVDGETCPAKIDALKLKFLGKKVSPGLFSLVVLILYVIITYSVMQLLH
ncbi:4Fe-4S binding protein [Psychrilyobacter atlanticus]|uniref:4Fe-4S binding protein n=1 Tax=Psychrilyobacter atlanticus TaxID=271091 RepID=UPI00040C62F5|nr:4Fe-4S binding protein [Psychrilyobacter atlanticus]